MCVIIRIHRLFKSYKKTVTQRDPLAQSETGQDETTSIIISTIVLKKTMRVFEGPYVEDFRKRMVAWIEKPREMALLAII